MKKLILTLSSSVVALSPVVAVIACGKNETDADKKAINELLTKVVDSSIGTDLSTVVDSSAYIGDAKTAIETKIKDLIKGDSQSAWTENTFEGIAFEFAYMSTSETNNQAITIRVKGTKNNKTETKNIVITGTADAELAAVISAIDSIQSTYNADVDFSSLVDTNAWNNQANETAKNAVIAAITHATDTDNIGFTFEYVSQNSTNTQAITIKVIATHKTTTTKTRNKNIVVTGASVELQEANATKTQLEVLTKPTAPNKDNAALTAELTNGKLDFTSQIANRLGLEGTFPTLAAGSKAEYSLSKKPTSIGSVVEYELSIWGKKGTTYSRNAIELTLQATDDESGFSRIKEIQRMVELMQIGLMQIPSESDGTNWVNTTTSGTMKSLMEEFSVSSKIDEAEIIDTLVMNYSATLIYEVNLTMFPIMGWAMITVKIDLGTETTLTASLTLVKKTA